MIPSRSQTRPPRPGRISDVKPGPKPTRCSTSSRVSPGLEPTALRDRASPGYDLAGSGGGCIIAPGTGNGFGFGTGRRSFGFSA